MPSDLNCLIGAGIYTGIRVGKAPQTQGGVHTGLSYNIPVFLLQVQALQGATGAYRCTGIAPFIAVIRFIPDNGRQESKNPGLSRIGMDNPGWAGACAIAASQAQTRKLLLFNRAGRP